MIDSTDSMSMNDLQLEDVEDYSADYPPVGFPQAEDNIHTNSFDSPTDKNFRRSNLINRCRTNKWIISTVFVAIVVFIATVVIVSGGNKDSQGHTQTSKTHQKPITVDPDSLDPVLSSALMTSLLSAYERHSIDSAPLAADAGETPQRLAFYWMATDKKLDLLDHTQRMQRFALATFYYSTNNVPSKYVDDPLPWESAHLWLSEAHTCEWMGVVCNENQHIEGIDMEDNHLTGKLPLELAFLDKLISLDLTSNLIHMSDGDFDVFKRMPVLETLLMDDNFLLYRSGLPPQFAAMTNLEKMRLSYNLFAGELEAEHKVLKHMSKLTHLEIESNFFTGTMPSLIGDMSNLVYLYMRRNEMSYNLDFLKTGNLESLFALWLDSNNITGTIPTEIGTITELASVSITNATLTGTIPTEIGNLKGLRRLWLYSNKLTGAIPAELDDLKDLEVLEVHHNMISGSMPQGVCQSIEKSDYQYKSLTSDCKSNKVKCDSSCCTECYN